MKFFTMGLALLITGASHASFDMMLMPNLSSRVNRYDPVNGVSLGGFNAGAARLVAIDQAQNRAFSWDATSSRIRFYNYNNGESLGTTSAFSAPKSLDYHAGSNRIFALSSTGIFYASPTTGFFTNFATLNTSISWQTTVISGNAITVFGKSSTGSIVYETFNCSTGASLGGGSTVTSILAASSFGKAAFFTGPAVANGFYAFSYIDEDGNMRLARSAVTATGTSGLITTLSLAGYASSNVMPALVNAHAGFFVVGQNLTTPTQTLITKYDNISGFTAEYTNTITGSTFTPGAYQVANVVAPEPGSMIALGLGLAALVRKRRSTV